MHRNSTKTQQAQESIDPNFPTCYARLLQFTLTLPAGGVTILVPGHPYTA